MMLVRGDLFFRGEGMVIGGVSIRYCLVGRGGRWRRARARGRHREEDRNTCRIVEKEERLKRNE